VVSEAAKTSATSGSAFGLIRATMIVLFTVR
jgi:hypothetical protein